jgi:hypothetical protein
LGFAGLLVEGAFLFALAVQAGGATDLVRWPLLTAGQPGTSESLRQMPDGAWRLVGTSAFLAWATSPSSISFADHEGRLLHEVPLRGPDVTALVAGTDRVLAAFEDRQDGVFQTTSLCTIDARNGASSTILTTQWAVPDVAASKTHMYWAEERDYAYPEPPTKVWALPLGGGEPQSLGCAPPGPFRMTVAERELCWASDRLYCVDLSRIAG